ncbi:MAG: CpaF/VirB11 family protein [Bacteriovoracaceae bacterium]|nr:CpaF/VirB11 family protein [Bacteriovoracaceae bacterium]
MLALFKENTVETFSPPVIPWARTQWRKFLDKGSVPSLGMLEDFWHKDFPETQAIGLEQWVKTLEMDWVFQNIDPNVREIFCHGPNFIESVGNIRSKISSPLDEEDWDLWAETLAARMRLEFNYTHPCGSAFLQYNQSQWRVTLLHSSISPQGRTKLFLRQLAQVSYPLKDYEIDSNGEEILKNLIQQKENILVAGATGSGKTSLLSSLLQHLDPEDHVVILEDTQEISCQSPRLTRMLSSRMTGRSLTDYLAHALRLSPDRILLGEMRSHEVVPYLLAMNTGHKGLMSTLHASSAVDALLRVAQLFVLASGNKDMSYQEVLRLVARNVGYVVYVEKRKIKQIIKVYGCDLDQPIYDVIWGA